MRGGWKKTFLFLMATVFLAAEPVRAATYPEKFFGMDMFGPAWQWVLPGAAFWEPLPHTSTLNKTLLKRMMVEAGQAGVKWNRMALNWCFVEREKGKFYWDDVDAMVDYANANGMETVPYFLYTPGWAVAGSPLPPAGQSWAATCINSDYKKMMPTDIADWENFVREAVRHLKSKGVKYWEIWNEPDLCEFFQVSPGVCGGDAVTYGYAKMLKSADRVIKEEDSTAKVLLGGFSDINGVKLGQSLVNLTSLGGVIFKVEDYFDIVTMHAYGGHGYKTDMIKGVFPGRTVWITEMNNPGEWCNAGYGNCKVVDYQKTQLGFGSLMELIRNKGVERVAFFTSLTSQWGPGFYTTKGDVWDEGSVANPFPKTPFYTTYQKLANPNGIMPAATATPTLVPTLTPTPTPTPINVVCRGASVSSTTVGTGETVTFNGGTANPDWIKRLKFVYGNTAGGGEVCSENGSSCTITADITKGNKIWFWTNVVKMVGDREQFCRGVDSLWQPDIPTSWNQTSSCTNTCVASVEVEVIGDANGDGKVNLNDLKAWKTEYLNKVGLTADFNGDKKIDLLDLKVWKTGYLNPSPYPLPLKGAGE